MTVLADKHAVIRSKVLNDLVEPVLLDNCPPALSVGDRCFNKGWEFHWPAYSSPFLINPQGENIELIVHNNVPFTNPDVVNDSTIILPAPQAVPIDHVQPDASKEEEPALEEPICEPCDEPNGEDSTNYRDLKAEANSISHLLTHLPKNPHCIWCQRAKTIAKKKNKQGKPSVIKSEKFGDVITMDHLISSDTGSKGINEESVGLAISDLGTGFVDLYPDSSKSWPGVVKAVTNFVGSNNKVKLIYSDNAPELVRAMEELRITHDTSTPYRFR